MSFSHNKILAFVLAFVIVTSGWIWYFFTTQKYISGAILPLLDLLPADKSITASKDGPRIEKLSGWKQVIRLNAAAVWKTSIKFPIASKMEPRLFHQNREATEQGDVFQSDAPAGHWWADRQSIWVTVPPDIDPSHDDYTVLYSPEADKDTTEFTESLEKPVIRISSDPLHVISVYRTLHAFAACKSRDGLALNSGLTHLEPMHFVLFGSANEKSFAMDSAKEIYENKRYYITGLIRWSFTASGTFAGGVKPQMRVLLDGKKVGSFVIHSKYPERYSLQTFVTEGFHTLGAQLVNDYFDPASHQDRNIALYHVEADNLDAVLLISAASEIKRQYDITYCGPEESGVTTADVDDNHEIRASLVLAPDSQIEFPVKVPDHGRLIFGLSSPSASANIPAATKLKITVRTLLKGRVEYFSYIAKGESGWKDETIDLEKLSGRRVMLRFETSSETIPRYEGRQIAISNPIVYSASNIPRRQLPYVFIVTADALRADHLSSYGYKRPTSPNIDLFAKDGVLFENAISQGAATLPSTSSLFTSVYPSMHRTDYNNSRLPVGFMTLPDIAQQNGYLTAGFVKNEFLSPAHGLSRGFRWYRSDMRTTEERIQPVLQWIESKKNLPAFVFFHMLHPHSPYVPPEQFARIFNATPSDLAASNQKLLDINIKGIVLPQKDREQLITLYDAEIRHLDAIFAQFIDELKRLGIYDRSLIIFLSDHGEGFQEHGLLLHGGALYQNMIHVPLILKLPRASDRRNLRITTPVQTFDLMPTILELAGIRVPDFVQGKSLLPLINGQADRTKRPVFSELLSARCLTEIKDGYKYIYSGYSRKEELYQLSSDPDENNNLSGKRADLMSMFRKDRAAFQEHADQWRKRYLVTETGEHIVLDEKQIEQLRSLGYIQ